MYANAPFIRPPGPFPSQSTASLERALIQSTRLAQSWTTPCLRAVSHVEIPFYGEPKVRFNKIELIGGRWLIVCQSKRRIVLYDTVADVETRAPQILYEREEQWQIYCWDTYSIASGDGQWVVYVLLNEEHHPPLPQWYVVLSSADTSYAPIPIGSL
ncbi:hypothetical protein OG21DRAFT_224619 [Imleria badia]|nr:hypothetical protein OG21DRAFT_224619 [Imleria badia]